MKLLQAVDIFETDRKISGENIARLFEGMDKKAARGTIGTMYIFDRAIALKPKQLNSRGCGEPQKITDGGMFNF